MPIKIILLFGGTILAFWISAITGGGASRATGSLELINTLIVVFDGDLGEVDRQRFVRSVAIRGRDVVVRNDRFIQDDLHVRFVGVRV